VSSKTETDGVDSFRLVLVALMTFSAGEGEAVGQYVSKSIGSGVEAGLEEELWKVGTVVAFKLLLLLDKESVVPSGMALEVGIPLELGKGLGMKLELGITLEVGAYEEEFASPGTTETVSLTTIVSFVATAIVG